MDPRAAVQVVEESLNGINIRLIVREDGWTSRGEVPDASSLDDTPVMVVII